MTTDQHTLKDELAQIFTPAPLAEYMTELLLEDLSDEEVLNATYLEPSAGTGDLLKPLLKIWLDAADRQQMEPEEVRRRLATNLHLIEYDTEAIPHLREALTSAAHATGFYVPKAAWQIHNQDALTWVPPHPIDYILGNPPYIRIHDMPAEMREDVKKYSMATGTTDLYIIFYQLGLQWLAPGGKLVYVAPNSWLKNLAQKTFREHLFSNGYLKHVTDYRAAKVFPKADTYVAVTVLQKPVDGEMPADYTFQVGEPTGWPADEERTIPYPTSNLTAPLTLLTEEESLHWSRISTRKRPLPATVSNGVQTSADKIYLNVTEEMAREPHVIEAVKGSRYRGGVPHRIVFPYNIETDGDATKAAAEQVASQSPHTWAWLEENREALESRDLEDNADWFHYGRSQGLAHVGLPKIVIAPLLHPTQESVHAHILHNPTVVHGGLYLLPEDGTTLSELLEALKDPDLARWIKYTGKDMAGGYKAFSAPTLRSYRYES